jgi:hypothetical protein
LDLVIAHESADVSSRTSAQLDRRRALLQELYAAN